MVSPHTLDGFWRLTNHAGIAQLVEQLSCKQQVPGSTPGAGTIWAPVAQQDRAFAS